MKIEPRTKQSRYTKSNLHFPRKPVKLRKPARAGFLFTANANFQLGLERITIDSANEVFILENFIRNREENYRD